MDTSTLLLRASKQHEAVCRKQQRRLADSAPHPPKVPGFFCTSNYDNGIVGGMVLSEEQLTAAVVCACARENVAHWREHQRKIGGTALTERGSSGDPDVSWGRWVFKNMCFCETNPPFWW